MTEADFKSIWDHSDIDDTRWSNIGTRMAKILNFVITGDATSQVTNTAVTPILEQLSEEGFRRIKMASKEEKFSDPYGFIMGQVSAVMTTIITENNYILELVKSKLGFKKMEIITVNLPDKNDRIY